MDVLNFRKLQNFKYKEQKLQETLKKQKSIIQKLRMEYESLKKDEEVKTTPAEKLKQKKNLRSIYTFKLPVSRQKNKDDIEVPERVRNGWIQRPLSELPPKIQDLNKQRSRMIELGNSYSVNNRKCPLVTKTIRSVKTQHEMKYEMLNRAKQLGNHYSFRFRQHHPLKVYKKSIDSYKKHERLISQKNEMEGIFRSGGEMPQIFPQKYLHVLNEIHRLEEELNLNHQFSNGNICQDILNSDCSSWQSLINQLSYPIFDKSDVSMDEIQIARAIERIDIGKILGAKGIVDQKISEVFWNKEDVEDGDLDSNVLKYQEGNSNNEEIVSEESNADIDIKNAKSDVTIDTEIEKQSDVFNPANDDSSDPEIQEFPDETEDVVIENEEIVYINEKHQSKVHELESNTEYLDRPSLEFFAFKNLILEISEKASSHTNERSLATTSTSLNNLHDNQIVAEKTDSSIDTLSPIFSQKLDSKLTETLKAFCKNYIEDLFDIPNIPKHHPSFEDVRINFIHETTSNVDAGHKSDDSREISQVSNEICKSQSSILRTQSVESSKLLEMTSNAKSDENYITCLSQEFHGLKSYNYSREMALLSIENPQSAVAMLYN